MENIKEILKVDKNNLHEEWEKQPQIYMDFAEKWVSYVAKRDKIKEKLDLVKAKLDGQIRENPELFGFTKKPTEAAITSAIIKSDEYRNVMAELHEANEMVNLTASIKTALEHRKKALEALTQLFIAGYYSQPSLSESEVNMAKEAHHRKIQEEIREVLRNNDRLTDKS